MRKIISAILLFIPFCCAAQNFTKSEIMRFKNEARAVTIIRDNWGIPHIYGKTGADAVFGLMYAECEENFKGVERNYLYQLGRQSEVDGESKLYSDIQLQLIADSADRRNLICICLKRQGFAAVVRDTKNATFVPCSDQHATSCLRCIN